MGRNQSTSPSAELQHCNGKLAVPPLHSKSSSQLLGFLSGCKVPLLMSELLHDHRNKNHGDYGGVLVYVADLVAINNKGILPGGIITGWLAEYGACFVSHKACGLQYGGRGVAFQFS